MTKKDYIIIARALNKVIKIFAVMPADMEVINEVVNALSVEMSKDNPKFDHVKFREAVYK